jgi:putative transposase
MMSMGIHGLFPKHFARDVDFGRGKKLHYYDHLIKWKKPPKPSWMSQEEYTSYPSEIELRETDVSREVREKSFVLATTLVSTTDFCG